MPVETVRGAHFVLTDEGDHLRIEWDPGTEITADDARESIAAVERMRRGAPLVVQMGQVTGIPRPARAIYAQMDVVSRMALVAQSPLSRTIANFFLGLNRTPVPMRMFTDEDVAVAWLREGV